MSSSASLLRASRLLHLYIGVFIAPALLFFAFTGALQTFSLHETTRGSSYQPPRWAVVLGQIHKKQTPVVPNRKPAPPPERTPGTIATPPVGNQGQPPDSGARHAPSSPAPSPSSPPAPPEKTHNPLPLKIFFLIVAVGLFTSTLTGIYMSYKYVRNTSLVTVVLVAGAVIPIVLVLI